MKKNWYRPSATKIFVKNSLGFNFRVLNYEFWCLSMKCGRAQQRRHMPVVYNDLFLSWTLWLVGQVLVTWSKKKKSFYLFTSKCSEYNKRIEKACAKQECMQGHDQSPWVTGRLYLTGCGRWTGWLSKRQVDSAAQLQIKCCEISIKVKRWWNFKTRAVKRNFNLNTIFCPGKHVGCTIAWSFPQSNMFDTCQMEIYPRDNYENNSFYVQGNLWLSWLQFVAPVQLF